MLADEVDYVVGVDTHRDEHVLAVVAAPAGAVVAKRAVRASARGYREALCASPRSTRTARGCGRSRVSATTAPGLPAFSPAAARPCSRSAATPRAERRLRGKDDSLDAIRTARAALASETLALPRSGERREALRLLLLARRSAVDVRREALVQLRSVIVTAPERLREELRGLPVGRLLERCSRLRRSSGKRPTSSRPARPAHTRPTNRSGDRRGR